MKQQIAVLIACAMCVAQIGAIDLNRPGRNQNQEQEQGKKQLYTCVMHPEIVRTEPGQCPKCGMTLVPLQEQPKQSTSPEHRTATAPDAHRSHMSDETHDPNGNEMPTHHGENAHTPSHRPGAAIEMAMRSSINVTDLMSREASGTSWVPDSSPMYGYMRMFGDDMLMLHGAIFPRYTNVSSDRGGDRIDSPNWIMAMYSHPFSDTTQLGLRTMMSLDLLTEGGRGYPLLLQSGESWNDKPLHDRQHPHDLFDELSFSLSQKFADELSGYIYFGYPGEPALGPPAFMHRPSAMDNPDAPISHHWQDSTHIVFGVATAGLQWNTVKVEGSIFTGREPDEQRYDFDRPRFDSYSGRISWNPTPDLALQISHGYLKSPEDVEPQLNQHRTTGSLIYNKRLGPDSNLATSLVWGQNNTTHEGRTESLLVEANYQRERDAIYGRFEWVQKSGHELVLAPRDLDEIFDVTAASIGYVRDLSHGNNIDVGLGGQFTLDFWPSELDHYYGGGPGYGFQIFVRVRPSQHSHDPSERR